MITYNHLNLPVQISFGSGKNIIYLYNAAGQKVSKKADNYSGSAITDYLAGGFQYTDGILNFFPHAEGYVKANFDEQSSIYYYNYVFNFVDHLGNVRLSYGKYKGGTIIIEENNYYPFGLKHANYNTTKLVYERDGMGNIDLMPCSTCPGMYQYKYNGKEYQDELGLNMYDYGARNYDPAIGRWMNIDPLAETSRRFSPYTYALNNPVYFIDPDGMEAEAPVDNSGTLEKDDYENKIDMGYGKMVDADKVSGSVESTAGTSKLTDKGKKKFQAAALKDAVGSGLSNVGDTDTSNKKTAKKVSKLPNPKTYLNGEQVILKNGDTYQLNNCHWVKLDGTMMDLNAVRAGSFGLSYIPPPRENQMLVDTAINRDNMKVASGKIVDIKGLIAGGTIALLSTKNVPTYTFAGTILTGFYNLYSGIIDQIEINRTHDEYVKANR